MGKVLLYSDDVWRSRQGYDMDGPKEGDQTVAVALYRQARIEVEPYLPADCVLHRRTGCAGHSGSQRGAPDRAA